MNPSAIPTNPINTLQSLSSIPTQVQLQQQQQQAPLATTPASPAHQPSWWQRLLPTAGGILGGLAGEAVDVFGGGIGGAAAGGALGQKLENELTGSNGSTLAAAGENALGQGVGSAIGKGLSAVASKVVSPVAEKSANALLAGQATPGLITPELANELRVGHGITDLNQGGKLASIYTGSADSGPGQALINKTVENGINANGPARIDLTDLTMRPVAGKNATIAANNASDSGSLIQHFMTKNQLLPAQQNAVRANLSAITDANGQTIGGSTDAAGALNFQRSVSNLANKAQADFVNSGRNDVNAQHLAQTYNEIASEANDRLFSPGDQDVLIPQTEKDALVKDIQTHATPVNAKSATQMANDVQGANSYRDLRALQAKWVTVNQALQKTADLASRSYGTTTGDLARAGLPVAGALTGIGGPKSLLGTAAGLATKSSAADKVGSSALDKLGGVTNKNSALVKKVLPLASKISAITATNLPNDVQQSNSAIPMPGQGVNSMIPQQPGQGAPQVGGVPQASYGNIINDLTALSVLDPNHYGGMASAVLPGVMPQLQHNAALGATVNNLMPAYEAAGGAQGLGGGILSRLTSLIPGTAAHTFQGQVTADAQQLAKVLGISPEAAAQMLPQLTQNPQIASQQIGGLGSVLGSLPGGGTPSAIPAQ